MSLIERELMHAVVVLAACAAPILTACGTESTIDSDQFDDVEAAVRVMVEAASPGRRGELHSILKQDPENSGARDELVALDENADLVSGLIFAYEPKSGSVVKFFEPFAGDVVVLAGGPAGDTPVIGARGQAWSIPRIWETVSGGEEMPAVLAEAHQRALRRAEVLMATPESEREEREPGDTAMPRATPKQPSKALQHVTSSGAHFRDAHDGCANFNSEVRLFWCLTGMVGSSTPATADDTEQAFTRLHMFAGSQLTWSLNWDGTPFTVTVHVGEEWTWAPSSPLVCVGVCWFPDKDFRAQILDGDAQDAWHWGGTVSDDGWALLQ